MLMLGAGLLVQAALVVAQLVSLPIWVAVVECLCVSMVGLWQLRRMTAALDRAATAAQDDAVSLSAMPRSVAAPWSAPLAAFPARVAPALDKRSEPAVPR